MNKINKAHEDRNTGDTWRGIHSPGRCRCTEDPGCGGELAAGEGDTGTVGKRAEKVSGESSGEMR